MASLFITFEGQEGAGKSTQIKMLYKFLSDAGDNVILTREPGGTDITEKIRRILKDAQNADITKEAEALLYVAARAQLVDEVIKPHLEADGIVLCDRYEDSTIAYQGFGNALDIDRLTDISNFASKGLVPDITFLLKIEPSVGLARKSAYKMLDRIEAKDMTYHNAVQQGYDYLTEKNPGRIVVIDGTLPPDEIFGIIVRHVEKLKRNAG